ncbi:MAG: M48 family metallopeptidase [Acidobacteria bacterium]|nr:M48 family metallopeptidase [Acidobacteriota bacterium]
MDNPNAALRVCVNGHQSRDAAARFCIVCGTPLGAPAPPKNAVPPPNAGHPNAAPPKVAAAPPKTPVSPPKTPVSQPPVAPVSKPPEVARPANSPPPKTPVPPPPNNYPPNHHSPPAFNPNPPPFDPNYHGQPNQPSFQPPPFTAPHPPSPAPSEYPPPVRCEPVQYAPIQPAPAPSCRTCGGDGRGLAPKMLVCPECRWLRPLVPGYAVETAAFQWSEDGKAMSALRAVKVLTSAAQAISDKVGRPWIESMFNAVRLGENQLPKVYGTAVHAARILGMTHMPDVYVSGEVMWDCRTYGSDKSAFIVIGTALATNFQGLDLLFLLAREMGHCRAGHALWKTVIKFLLGEQGPRKGLLGGGILNALNPTHLIEGAIEMPLLGWARQAEITADRAGLLAVGSEEVARRVLLSWTLKSAFLYKQINVEAWLAQQADGDDHISKLSELTTSATPYITRRLKLMDEFAKSPDLRRWRQLIRQYTAKPKPAPVLPPAEKAPPDVKPAPPAAAKPAPPKNRELKIKCAACGTPMRVPLGAFEGRPQIKVRCPNKGCAKIATLKKGARPAAANRPPDVPSKAERSLNYDNE